MHNDVVTVFNYHEKTSVWYTTVFKNTHLLEVSAETATRDSGRTNDSEIELIIPIIPNRIADNDGNTFVADDENKISYRDPDTDDVRKYIGPKAFAGIFSALPA